MATKKEITEDIRAQYGNALTAKQVLKCTGYSSYNSAKQLLARLDSFSLDGGHRKYLAIDVAAEIYRCQERAAHQP